MRAELSHASLAESGLEPDVWLDPGTSKCGLHTARVALRRRYGLVALIANPNTTGWPPPGDAPIISTRRAPAGAQPGGRVQYLGRSLSRIGGGRGGTGAPQGVAGLNWEGFLKDPGSGNWAAVPLVQSCAAVARIVKGDDAARPQPERPTAQSLRERQFRQSLHLSTSTDVQAGP